MYFFSQTRPITRLVVDKVKPKEWFKYSLYCRLTTWNSARLFHHVLFNMGDLHSVLPALNLSTLNDGILIMMQQVDKIDDVLTEHGGLLHVLPLAVHLRPG